MRGHRPLYHLTSEVEMAFPFPLQNTHVFKLVYFSPFQFLLVGVLRGKGFPDSSVVKNPSANTGDLGLIPGLGRSPWEESMATQSSIHAWRILWTEEPGGLQSIGLQRIRYD